MTQRSVSSARIVAYGLAALNLIGIAGLAWFVTSMLTYDGVMVVELSLCLGLIAALAGLTWGGVRAHTRGRTGLGIALLAIGAVPVAAAIGFFIYLEANPIDWR